ncbi:saccharopine dehydrogenase family protein [Rhodoferax sp. TS-BS-61-7]|uniref:saccharopine dehydrogenase family protein n=1 Tax=Rhodoferax sp. TS-BS-61-7 TaxID=2094194 RepID=UPI000CF62EC5|nr:saccharopine dehydrogenase NADP-binding domain-containing protein [Rhodoferax sp. TS-BS-61-7]PQA78061.1 saccharopine dehydrogenase [Rhodoferax sp. TS-BS-61-7]
MQETRILVIGGYGFFGRRLVERLSLQSDLHIIVAGRSGAAAESLVGKLRPAATSQLSFAVVDAMHQAFASEFKKLNVAVVVNASGPFQGEDYRVAGACIAAGAHYIDLADGREFVAGIGTLNSAALKAGVLVTSGASSVPALSSAVADHLVKGLQSVKTIDVGISPGNRTERGLSTVRGILSYCGKELPTSAGKPLVGWLNSYRHSYPDPVGSRLHSPCDVPDLALLPARYAGHPEVRFGAGLELEFLHRGMNLMAWMARHGQVKNWSAHAQWLKRAADLVQTWGTDAGAMHVAVSGIAPEGRTVSREWQLVATHGDGPYVPTLAASALVRKLHLGGPALAGAMPCVGLLTLEDFAREMQGLKITTSETAQ